MGAIFKNLSFNQLKTLGIFSVANAKQQQGSGSNSNPGSPSPSPSPSLLQQQQFQQAQMLLAAQRSDSQSAKETNGQVIVLDI